MRDWWSHPRNCGGAARLRAPRLSWWRQASSRPSESDGRIMLCRFCISGLGHAQLYDRLGQSIAAGGTAVPTKAGDRRRLPQTISEERGRVCR